MLKRTASFAVMAAVLAGGAAHAGSCVDPANFVPGAKIESRWADFLVGQRATYSDGEEKAVVTVLPYLRKAGGITWRAVLDLSSTVEKRSLCEATVDFYAENRQGDVCYGGETTVTFEGVDEECDANTVLLDATGSFLHGVHPDRSAQAGMYMPANPSVGQSWYIENVPAAEAVERAVVVSVTSTRLRLRIENPIDGEIESKTFDRYGELSSSVEGEAASVRTAFTPGE